AALAAGAGPLGAGAFGFRTSATGSALGGVKEPLEGKTGCCGAEPGLSPPTGGGLNAPRGAAGGASGSLLSTGSRR
ncbi:MAG: hypothetical protein KDB13_16930, partial [Microthrixaceae bacterium]|nr:hypothetical protein [Microthrixaceae bacterium]